MSVDFDRILKQVEQILPNEDDRLESEAGQRILEERAREISQRTGDRGAVLGRGEEHLIFVLGRSRYAVAARTILGIIKPLVTNLAGAPAWVVGVFNHRGTVYPLLDTHRVLLEESVSLRDSSTAILIAGETASAGLLVDEVVGTRFLQPGEGQGDGIYTITEDAIAVIDVDRLLADPRLRVDQGES